MLGLLLLGGRAAAASTSHLLLQLRPGACLPPLLLLGSLPAWVVAESWAQGRLPAAGRGDWRGPAFVAWQPPAALEGLDHC